MGTPYIVRGCTKPYNDQDTWPRLEINDLAQDPYQFSLFIQAMKNIQAEGYAPAAASWKEIAGIHGVPWARWAGDPEGPEEPERSGGEKQWDGYCYHSSVLFPTWHRVVVLFLEQVVVKEAQAILSRYPEDMDSEEREMWTKAAFTLRFPYWDWSDPRVGTEGMPKILSYGHLRIQAPGGTTMRIKNPLRGYTYDSPPDDVPGPDYKGDMRTYFAEWKRTVRWATGKNDPEDDYMTLDTALKKGLTINVLGPDYKRGTAQYRPISVNREKLVRVFKFPPEVEDKDQAVACWEHFAVQHKPKSALPPEISNYVSSIEEPHNNIHNDIGGNGNMSFLEMAGYDPIFFLHHCNIDRLYALWEYVYPDYWMGEEGYKDKDDKRRYFKVPHGTYQSKLEAEVTASTDLAPFRKNGGKYWTSNDVRGLTPDAPVKKYYSYPPLEITYEQSDGLFDAVETTTVIIDVTKPCTLEQRKQYIAALQYHFGDRPAQLDRPGPALPPIFHHLSEQRSLMYGPDYQVVDGTRDFVIVATLPQFAFRGSYRLELYLGTTYIGDVSVLSRLKPENCKQCSSNIASGDDVVRGVVGIPHGVLVRLLEAKGANTPTTSEDAVVATIKENLVGKLVRPDRTSIARGAHKFVTGNDLHAETRWLEQASFDSYALQETKMPRAAFSYPVLSAERAPRIEIHSASVALHKSEFEPAMRADARDHGRALDGEWRHWHPERDSA